MKGLIIRNAYSESDSGRYQFDRLSEEFEKLGAEVDVKNNDFFAGFVGSNGELIRNCGDYDFCVYFDKDKYIANILEKFGMRLFNKPKAIFDCDDKMQTFIKLSNHNLPMPKTLPGLLCYSKNEKIKPRTVDFIEKQLGYPMIVKSSYGSFGTGVFKIDDRRELCETMEKLKCRPHLFQEYVDASFGKDLRVIVIGGKFVCGYMRNSEADFRSNIALGGTGFNVEIPSRVIKLCEKVARILKLDYCGVDVLFDKDDYKICEVNSNAFFCGAEKTTGVNVAGTFAKYVLESVRNKSKK